MTQDEIIKLVEDNGLTLHGDIEHFAELVAQHEREACAKLCAEDNVQAMDFTGGTFVGGYFSKKIIDRGEA